MLGLRRLLRLEDSIFDNGGRGGGSSARSPGELGRLRSSGMGGCSLLSLLGRLLRDSGVTLLKAFIGGFPSGLLGSKVCPCRELERDGPRSPPFGVFLPLLVDGRRLFEAGMGKGGKAQSKFAESSGLGGRGSHRRGIGLVILRNGGAGLFERLLPERELAAGEMGSS